jgi:hypothetical protein
MLTPSQLVDELYVIFKQLIKKVLSLSVESNPHKSGSNRDNGGQDH